MEVTIEDNGLAALGIENFDITNNFNIDDIDKAIDKVFEVRSDLGVKLNRFDHIEVLNRNASSNQRVAQSRIRDLDIGRGVMELSKNKVLEQYRIFAQQQEQM